MPSLKTEHLTPSAVLQRDQYFGTYDRAVAWLACEGQLEDPAGTPTESVMLTADLFGCEPGAVIHDAQKARERQKTKPVRSIRSARLKLHSRKSE